MQSLNFKVFTEFNTARRWPWLGRPRCRDITRICKTIACSSEKNIDGKGNETTGSFVFRSQTRVFLKQQIEVAAKSEDYKEAARITDSMRLFGEEEPVLHLRRLMKEAVANERFEDAARYRNELQLLAPHTLLKCSSDATTLEILWISYMFALPSYYVLDISPRVSEFRIRITNNSHRPVQLLRRHWIITDANGKTENIWGIGIIGEQPVILPKTSFEYSSACSLNTPTGRMEGDFEMMYIDKVRATSFNVAIAPFSLSIIGDDTDII